ncbi:uncharacterized protein GO595_000646 [Histomonas meleagridis]|uniref:uncharacterized protein n=1 Tax=Histomonas meleagridis TaxID=135588 RepID=UPI0035594FE6|nr:hypothetical protein GO595_000646 [Histomonas meleagridis]
MIFPLIALSSIKIPTKPIVITTPTKPIDIPIKPVLLRNEEEESELLSENKLNIKKVIKKAKKVLDAIDQVVNGDEEEVELDDPEVEVYYVVEEAPEYGANKFSFKKIFKKFGKVIKVVVKVVKNGSKIITALNSESANSYLGHKRQQVCVRDSISRICKITATSDVLSK